MILVEADFTELRLTLRFCFPGQDEGMDQFNWGVHRHSLSSLNAEGEKDNNTTPATPTLSRKVPVRPSFRFFLVLFPRNRSSCVGTGVDFGASLPCRTTASKSLQTTTCARCRRWTTWRRPWAAAKFLFPFHPPPYRSISAAATRRPTRTLRK